MAAAGSAAFGVEVSPSFLPGLGVKRGQQFGHSQAKRENASEDDLHLKKKILPCCVTKALLLRYVVTETNEI